MNRHMISAILLFSLAFSLGMSEEMLDVDSNCRVLMDDHDKAAMMTRNFVGTQSNRWPNGIVPYTISSGFTASQRQVIMSAMRQISDRTCVRFVPRTNQQDYMNVFTGQSGCYANLGYRRGRGRSVVHLQSNGCVFLGIVVHEFLHILGFSHEQNRPDRDQFVRINWANIRPGTYNNFWRSLGQNEAAISLCSRVDISQYDQCYGGFRASTFGIGYDFGSVMHYGLTAFSTNGRRTIDLRVSTNIRIPNRSGMSDLDAQKTRAAYGCNDEGQTSTTTPPPTTTPTTPTTTAVTTPTTTAVTTPGECVDISIYCRRYQRSCGRSKFVSRRCQKTCFNCQCENQLGDQACDMLSSYCRYSFIRRVCNRRCELCE